MLLKGTMTNPELVMYVLHVSGSESMSQKEFEEYARARNMFEFIDRKKENSSYLNSMNPGACRVAAAKPDAFIAVEKGRWRLTEHSPARLASLIGRSAFADMESDIEEMPPIEIKVNTQRALALSIEGARPGLILREIIQNAQEAPPPPDGSPLRIDVTRYHEDGYAPKLCVINNAQGMDHNEFIKLLTFNESGKEWGIDKNRGEGVKLSLLKYNPAGLRFFSRRGTKTRTAFMYLSKSGWTTQNFGNGKQIGLVQDEECYRSAIPEEGDFTSVVLYGKSDDHDTSINPYDVENPESNIVGREIFNRFHSLIKSDTRINISRAVAGRENNDNNRGLLVQSTLQANYPDRFLSTPVKLSDGVVIEYVEALHSDENRRTAYTQHSCGDNSSRAALVFQNEFYDIHTRDDWREFASKFAMGTVAQDISVFIHLPPDYRGVVADRYRAGLDANSQALRCTQFASEVIVNRPKWVMEKIQASFTDHKSNLKDRFAELIQHLAQQSRMFSSNPINTNLNPAGKRNNPTPKPSTSQKPKPQNQNPRMRGITAEEPENDDKPLAPPEVQWTNSANLIQLTGRIAFYSKEDHTIYMNDKHPLIDRKINEVFSDLIAVVGQRNKADLGEMITAKAHDEIGWTIGKHILEALAMNGTAMWPNQGEEAFGKETLQAIANTTSRETIRNAVQEIPKFEEMARSENASATIKNRRHRSKVPA